MNIKHITILIVVFGNILIADSYFKPSFDCSKISNKQFIEYSICANSTLSELDNIISELYKQLLEVNKNKEFNIRVDQRKWLKERNSCKTITCIENFYLRRENYLGNLLVKYNRLFYTNKAFWRGKDTLKFVKNINEDKRLVNYDLKVLNCDTLWLTIAGQINTGYAGICNGEKQGKSVFFYACYNMAFSYKIIEIENKKDEFRLIKFLKRNCWGG